MIDMKKLLSSLLLLPLCVRGVCHSSVFSTLSTLCTLLFSTLLLFPWRVRGVRGVRGGTSMGCGTINGVW